MKWKIFLLIAVISVAVYFNSFQNSFHFDDQHFIVENIYIRDISNIPSFFFSPNYLSFEKAFTGHYRPLLVTSYTVNYALGGLRPAGYHVVNLLFHVGSAFLVFLILQAMLLTKDDENTPPLSPLPQGEGKLRGIAVFPPPLTGGGEGEGEQAAILAALIFAIHPFNSEVVNYITARSSVMCAFFYLLAFYSWVKYRGEETDVRRKKLDVRSQNDSSCSRLTSYVSRLTSHVYLISLLAFLLAILTKEIAITLPLMLFLYDFYFYKQPGGSKNSSSSYQLPATCYLPYLPYVFLIIAPYLAYRISVYGHIVGNSSRAYLPNLLTQTKVLLKYIQLMFVPSGLTIEHDIKLSGTIYDGAVVLCLISLLIVLGIAYLLFRWGREWRVLSFFILWFFITLLPTTIIPLNAVLQENRGYLAGLLFAVAAGIVISKLKGKLAIPVLVLFVIGFSILTIQRNFTWRDDLSLWSDAVAKSPLSARAHDNLGLAYMGMQKYDLALEEFNKTLELNPQYFLAYYNAGVIYQLQGDFGKARSAYEASLKISPAYFRSYYNAGIVYKKLGELDMAVSSYEKAVALDSRHAFVYNNLGVVLTEKGDYKRAEDVFKRAVAINPGYEKAYYNLGNVYFRDKEYGKAAEAYRAAVRIRPDYKEADEMLKKAIARL